MCTFGDRLVVVPDDEVADGRGSESAGRVTLEDGLAIPADRLVEVLVCQWRRKVFHVTIALNNV